MYVIEHGKTKQPLITECFRKQHHSKIRTFRFAPQMFTDLPARFIWTDTMLILE